MTHSPLFVGITGIAFHEELEKLSYTLGHITFSDDRRIQAGVLMSDHTLSGGKPPVPRYPFKETAYELLLSMPSNWTPILHYNSRSEQPLSEQIHRLLTDEPVYETGICRAVQLNIRKPNPEELRIIRKTFPELRIIQQVPMWQENLQESSSIIEFAKEYLESVNYLLFDPSGGRGQDLSLDALALIRGVVEAMPTHIGVVLAGGLSGKNVRTFYEQASEALRLPFSVDAEGKLRGGSCYGTKVGDRINPERVSAYLEELSAVL